jgi:mRNA interferase MazF
LRNGAYEVRDLVIVAPITSRIRNIATEVALGREDGLPRACVANLDTLTTVPKTVLTRRLTELSSERIAAVDRALRFALGPR